MLKYLLALIVLTHLTIYPQDNFKRVDSLLNAVTHMDIFSGVVLVTKGIDIKILKAIGYADENKKIKLKTNTRFDRVINPGFINEIIILQLVQQGKISLTDSIGKYLKMFNNESDNNITVEDLLCLNYKPVYFIDKQAIQQAITNCPFFIEPGKDTTFRVQKIIVMWRLIETLTRKPYSLVVKKQIFDKVEMTQSIAGYSKNIKNIAHPIYNNLPDSSLVSEQHAALLPFRGIYTTASDFMKFEKSYLYDEKILKNQFKYLEYPNRKNADSSSTDSAQDKQYFALLSNQNQPLLAGFFDAEYSIIILYNKWDQYNESGDLLYKLKSLLLYPERPLSPWPCQSLILLGIINEKGIKYFKNNFDAINKTNPIKNPNTLNTLGDDLDKLNRFNDALEVYKINYTLYPNNEDTNRGLGDIYIKLGQKELGETYLDKADELKKEDKAAGGEKIKPRK